MSKERARSLKSAQLGMREMNIKVVGASGTPSISGMDEFQISSVVDNGVGDYTIIFKKPFHLDREPAMKGYGAITAQTHVEVSAIAYDRITVSVMDLAGAAKDADFYLCIIGTESRYKH